jgi:hypothetical protein
MRIAFSDASDSTNPVLQGVLAISSLKLHGNTQGLQYKRFVMSSITETSDWEDEKTLLQNLMATMLLYHYEVCYHFKLVI